MIELGALTEILKVAGTGVTTLGGAVDVVGRLKALSKGGASEAELKELAGQLAEQLYSARMTNLEVVTLLQDLKAKAEKEDELRKTLARYQPHSLPRGGKLLRLAVEDPDRIEWELICPVCANRDGLISPLQGDRQDFALGCAVCNSTFRNADTKGMGSLRSSTRF